MEPRITPLWAILIQIDIVWLAIGIFLILVIATGIGMSMQGMRIRLWAKLDKSVEEKTEYFLVSGCCCSACFWHSPSTWRSNDTKSEGCS